MTPCLNLKARVVVPWSSSIFTPASPLQDLRNIEGWREIKIIAQHNLIFSVILSCGLRWEQTGTKQRVCSSENRRRAIRVASDAQFWKRQRCLISTVYMYVEYKDTHVHAQRHSQFLFFQAKTVVGRSVFEVRLARWKNLTAELRKALKITHVEKSHHELKGKVFPYNLELI